MIGRRLRIGLFVGLLLLPLAQTAVPLLPAAALSGVERTVPPRRALSARSWWRGEFQERFEPWFARALGPRPWLVRTDNQIALSLFGQARTGGSPVVIGRDHVLYEKLYLDAYARGSRKPRAELRAAVEDLLRLRGLLARRGIALVLVVAPSKAELVPESLPPGLSRGREGRPSTYDRMLPLLAASGLELVDGHALLLAERRRGGPAVFARGGTHWNHYGAALVVERLLDALDRARPGRFVRARVTGARVDDRPWSTDSDLADLLNVWRPGPYRGPQTHPILAREGAGRALPRLLFVGDSFSLTLLRVLGEERLMAGGENLYYFRRRLRWPDVDLGAVRAGSFDVAGALAGQDAVVLVLAETRLPAFGFGFLPAALAALEGRPAAPAAEGAEAGDGEEQGL